MTADRSAEPSAQPLLGYFDNDAWHELLGELNARIQALDSLADPTDKEDVFALLQTIDAVHREALHRLVRLFKDGVLEQVVTDPAIHTLMELYDLLPPEPEPSSRRQFPDIPIKVVAATDTSANPSAPDTERPRWLPLLESIDSIAAGTTRLLCADERTILLCRVDDELFAVAGECAIDSSPFTDTTLGRFTLACPHHPGCLYDVRHGGRIGTDQGLACYPVEIGPGGRVMVGLGMPFQPNLPSL